MQQNSMNLIDFQREFATEKACQQHLFDLQWPDGYRGPRCGHTKASFHSTRHLYQCTSCKYQLSLTAGTIFHKTRTPLRKWFWMIFLMGRQKSGISMLSLNRMLEIKGCRTVWIMGDKIRKAMAERDAYYKLAGIVEMDDTYFSAPQSGKRGRGAAGKAKVVVAVEAQHDKPGFATIQKVKHLRGDEIPQGLTDRLEDNVVSRSDGWRAYGGLNCGNRTHQSVMVGTGEHAVKVLPWVHTVIANVKGNIRGVYHGVGSKHLSRYLSEF